jgi:lambda family phage portal protein
MGLFSWLAPRKRRTKASALTLPPALARLQRQSRERAPRSRNQGFLAGYSDGLAASKKDRLTDDWQPTSLSPTSIHRMDHNLLLRRARDLVENNPYAKSGVEAYVANVVGCGITPKPLLDSPVQRKQWIEAWNWWGGEYVPQADYTGQQHIYELMALWLEEVIVAGGCLTYFRPLDPDQYRDQPIKLAIELIPEERFADEKDDYIAWLAKKKTANPIVRGVERDPRSGVALGYWIRPAHPSEAGMAMEPVRLDARDCRYAYFKRRIGQVRGFSLLKAVVMWLWKLGYYVDNELMASAIKSCFAVLINTDAADGDFEGLEDDSEGSFITDTNGNPLEKIEPGIIGRFKGKDGKVSGIGPNTPTNDQEAWIVMIQRSIGIGMGLSYEELVRDYSRANFGSLRAGANSDRKRFRPMQHFVVNHFGRPIWMRFVHAATQAGLDGFPRPSQLTANYHDFLRCAWRLPGWASVNPWDDARAAVMEIDNGLSTREDYIASKGERDWEDVDEQAEREAESERARGLNYGKPGSVDTAQPGEGQMPTNQEARRA